MVELIVGLIVDEARRSHEQAGCAQLKSERLYGGALLNSGQGIECVSESGYSDRKRTRRRSRFQ